MAAVTHRAVVNVTTNTAGPFATGSFTPAVGDLLVLMVAWDGTATDLTVSDSQGGSWSFITSALKNSGADRLHFYVRDSLIVSAVSMTVTVQAGAAGTGCLAAVASVSGMSKVGTAAVRQSAKNDNNGAGTTPQTTFAVAALTGNPVFALMGNTDNPAGITPPATFTERQDIGHNTPTKGLEYATVNSGFTGTVITWGSASVSGNGCLAVELDASAGGTAYNQSVDGAITPAGGLAKALQRAIAGAVSPAGAQTKRLSRAVAGAATPSGAATKRLSRATTGAASPSGALASTALKMRSVAGALTPAGALSRAASRALAGATTPAGAVVRASQRALSGAATPSGALSSTRAVLQTVAGVLALTGAVTKRTLHVVAGAVSPAGAVVRGAARALAGAVSPSGAIVAIRTYLQSLSGAVGPAGDTTQTYEAGEPVVVGGVLTRTTRVADITDDT